MGWLLLSQRKVVVAAAATLVLLDAGRADSPPGARVYAQRCAICHGSDGRGNGPASASLRPPPRDFTLGEFKYKSTPAGAPPADADLIRTVNDGLRASAMPYFSDLLSDGEVRAAVAYVKTLSAHAAAPAEPLRVSARVPPDAASLARGKDLYLHSCAPCHGDDYRGGEREPGAPPARDLTAPWTFRGGSEPEQVWLRLTVGMVPSPMPSWAATLSDEQRWDLVNFVESVARVPPWAPGGRLEGPGQDPDPLRRGKYLVQLDPWGMPWFVLRALTPEDALAIATYLATLPPVQNRVPGPLELGTIETLALKWTTAAERPSAGVFGAVAASEPSTPEQAALVQRGRYLFKVSSCTFCHGANGSGGARISWKPFGTLFASNLTSDRVTGIGAWSDEQIARAIRSGVSRDGRQLHWQGMTWDLLSNLDEEDLRALVAYLRTLPAVRKAIPPPRPPGPGDCELYRFSLRGERDKPGCR